MNILIAFIFYMNINYLFKKKKLIEKKMALRIFFYTRLMG